MMANKKILLLLPLLALACTLSSAGMIEPFPTKQLVPSPIATMLRVQITQQATRTHETHACKVTAQSLHLRAMPGTSAQVIAYLHSGDLLTVLPDPASDNWIHVESEDHTGWVNSKYTNCEVTP